MKQFQTVSLILLVSFMCKTTLAADAHNASDSTTAHPVVAAEEATSVKDGTDLLTLYLGPLRANKSYTTSFRKVAGGPLKNMAISIGIVGNYCDIVNEGLHYQKENGGPAFEAKWNTKEKRYDIPSGPVYAIEYDYHQDYWDGVDCDFYFKSAGGGGTTEPEQPEKLEGVYTASNDLDFYLHEFTFDYLGKPKYRDAVDGAQLAYRKVIRDVLNAARAGKKSETIAKYNESKAALKALTLAFYKVHADELDPELDAKWDKVLKSSSDLAKEIAKIQE